MIRSYRKWLIAAFGLFCLARGAEAQQSLANVLATRAPAIHADSPSVGPVLPPSSAETALQGMFTQADVVFAGEVTGITHYAGFVEVRFSVDDPVRGVAAGGAYTLREWSGLWVDAARYRVGERRLMLLHAASAAGLASPVGGTDGAVPLAGGDIAGTVDLRWITARVARQSQPGTSANVQSEASSGVTIAAVEATDRGVVMDLLRAWQRSAVAAR